tara:strand:+ start:1942 stop:2430 length:489 start_codon:yes stop_codon:yes gene_type:complete
MTYKLNKFFIAEKSGNPSSQILSTSYTEITGSKCEIKNCFLNNKIVYKFSFWMGTHDAGGSTSDLPAFMHIKLQKSNDNFSSNIEDIPGCQINISSDDSENEHYYTSVNPLFILENFNYKYLRIVGRSYSTSNEVNLHVPNYYDGSNASNIYYNPFLLVMEI